MRQFLIIITLLLCAIAFYVSINSYLANQSREAQLGQTKKLISEIETNEIQSKFVSDGKTQNRTEIEGLFQNCTDQNNQTQDLNQYYTILNYYDQLNQTIYESNKTCNEEIAKLNQTLYEIQPKSIQITNYTNAGICQIGFNTTYQFVSFSYKLIKMPKLAFDYYVFNGGGLNLTNSSTLVEIYSCAPTVFASQKLYHRKVLTQDGVSVELNNVYVGQGKIVLDILNPNVNQTLTLNNFVIY
jgi:hypothetical protein